MANALYNEWKEALLQGGANSSLAGTVNVVLIDAADYTFSQTHDFMDDVASDSRVGTPQTLGSKTYANGTFDAADVTFPTVTGDVCEAILLYVHTGADATARPVAYIDTGVTGLPVTPGGGDIDIVWDAAGIFTL